MNKQERENAIKKIYEEVADKTLSFWCKLIMDKYTVVCLSEYYCLWETWWDKWRIREEEIKKIIGHPVMIWDVLYYAEYILSESGWYDWVWQYETFESKLLVERHKKRTPIEDQRDSCILHVLSLIEWTWNKN